MDNPSSTSSSSNEDDVGVFKIPVVVEEKKSFKNLPSKPKEQRSFWNVLANKAKLTLLDDEDNNYEPLRQSTHARSSSDNKQRHSEIPNFQKKLESLTSSLSSFGDTIGNALEEGLNIVESKATDILSSDSKRLFTKKTFGSTKSALDSSREEHDSKMNSCSREEQDPVSSLQKDSTLGVYSQQGHNTVSRSQQQRQTGPKSHQGREFVLDPMLVQRELGPKITQWIGYSSKQDSGVEYQAAIHNDLQLEASRDVRPQKGRENLTKLFQGKDYNSDSQQIERDSGTKPIQRDVYMAKPLQQQDLSGQNSSTDDKDMQLKASRDVSMAMATKAKLLSRELKEAKAALMIAKQRCAQLEEENKTIRESFCNGLKLDEEDLVRIQLETLLAEKAHLAQENAYYARENQFLREMLEYHRLSMPTNAASLEYTSTATEFAFEETELPPETIISTVPS